MMYLRYYRYKWHAHYYYDQGLIDTQCHEVICFLVVNADEKMKGPP